MYFKFSIKENKNDEIIYLREKFNEATDNNIKLKTKLY